MDFTKADYAGEAPTSTLCAACKTPLVGQYWTAGDATVCGRCAEAVKAGPGEGGLLRVFKAFMFGTGAGLLGAIGYSLIITFLNMELALVTILIGWMVGRAVKIGSEGHGGRGYQVMGAVLTYGWCMMAYVPALVTGMTGAADPVPFLLAVVLSPLLALAIPFSGDMGPLGILILAFGVWRGWREPARIVLPVAGPFELAALAATVVAAPVLEAESEEPAAPAS